MRPWRMWVLGAMALLAVGVVGWTLRSRGTAVPRGPREAAAGRPMAADAEPVTDGIRFSPADPVKSALSVSFLDAGATDRPGGGGAGAPSRTSGPFLSEARLRLLARDRAMRAVPEPTQLLGLALAVLAGASRRGRRS